MVSDRATARVFEAPSIAGFRPTGLLFPYSSPGSPSQRANGRTPTRNSPSPKLQLIAGAENIPPTESSLFIIKRHSCIVPNAVDEVRIQKSYIVDFKCNLLILRNYDVKAESCFIGDDSRRSTGKWTVVFAAASSRISSSVLIVCCNIRPRKHSRQSLFGCRYGAPRAFEPNDPFTLFRIFSCNTNISSFSFLFSQVFIAMVIAS